MVPDQRVDVLVLDTLRHPDDDAPMTLQEACKVIFGGAIKPDSLRAEHRRGNLVLEKIGRTYFVTRASIRICASRCRVDPPTRAPAFGSSAGERTEMDMSRQLVDHQGRKRKAQHGMRCR